MAKEFSVPPMVFPSGGSDNIPHPRRAPVSAPTFQASRPSANHPGANPSLPFMSFDIGSLQSSSSSSSAAPDFTAGAITSASFDDELPLLEELGINTGQIFRKAASILNPLRVRPNLHEDADLSGPFLFLAAFGLFQLLAGKFHFGIILGWITVAALFLYVVFNMLAGRNGSLDLYRCLSLVGYCMLPMAIFSAVSLFVPHDGIVIFVMGAVFVLWSTRVCTRLLVDLASGGEEHRGLIAYACWLVFHAAFPCSSRCTLCSNILCSSNLYFSLVSGDDHYSANFIEDDRIIFLESSVYSILESLAFNSSRFAANPADVLLEKNLMNLECAIM